MLFWLFLSFGLGLAVAVIAVVLAMDRAERRARRTLYTALGYNDQLVAALMVQKGSIAAQLALVRETHAPAAPDQASAGVDALKSAAPRSLRMSRSVNGARTAPAARTSLRRSARVDRSEPS
jgi:hypothetical protein